MTTCHHCGDEIRPDEAAQHSIGCRLQRIEGRMDALEGVMDLVLARMKARDESEETP